MIIVKKTEIVQHLVYIGLKTNSIYKTANICSPKHANTNLKVEYSTCQGDQGEGKLEGQYTSV